VSVNADSAGRPGRVSWAHLIPVNPKNELWRIQETRTIFDLDVPFSEFIEELEAEFAAKADKQTEIAADSAMVVYVRTRADYHHEGNLAELQELCRTAGVKVVETYVQSRQKLDPKFAVGQGALEEIELRCLQLGAGMLIFGQDLDPGQSRSITDRTQLLVIDRTQLILDIFAQRAQSRVGKLQVELAQLKYRLPRLSSRNTGMSRLAGGIGGRGPGETKLEIDRRRARDRIRMLEKAVDRLGSERQLRRKNRTVNQLPVVSIVGYTNAGKSTLLNTLTQSTVLSEDKLFATLDPTSRRLRFPHEREIILTDTVGFIRDLPDELREAFRATLEELADADLLLHVVDASDPSWQEHVRSTERILSDLKLDETPRLLVFNKADRISESQRADLLLTHEGTFVSAIQRETTRELLDEIDRWLLNNGFARMVGDTERDNHDDMWNEFPDVDGLMAGAEQEPALDGSEDDEEE
jgi:GTP-binding protein HflX